ncbi:peptidoglycan-binding protein [Luteococcus sp.]|uniref:L,D-transpeptidase family protein n=1 Tax=Luteococcus sp. TaxID=1969402 RepID=UPI0037356A65
MTDTPAHLRRGAALLGLVSLAGLTSCAHVEPTAAPGKASVTVTTAASPSASGSVSSAPASPGPSQPPSAGATASASASVTASPSVSPTPSAAPRAVVSAASGEEKVRELQHRLQQLAWFEGRITGKLGEDTVAAVRGFQAKRGLQATGVVDDRTWKELVGRTKQPTHDQMHNILRPGPALLKKGAAGASVKDLQARLKQIGWFSGKVTDTYGDATVSAVEQFQAKRGIPTTGEVDQRTLDRLNAMTRKPTADELANRQPKARAARLDPRCMTGRVICISKTSRTLSWVVDGTVRSTMDVRFGSELTPTREGTFQVNFKSRDHVSTLYHTKMPFALFFSGGQAIHYSADFAARGYNGASHGCVNVRNYDAVASLFNQARTGDRVVVHR